MIKTFVGTSVSPTQKMGNSAHLNPASGSWSMVPGEPRDRGMYTGSGPIGVPVLTSLRVSQSQSLFGPPWNTRSTQESMSFFDSETKEDIYK